MSDLIAAPIDWAESNPAAPRYWLHDPVEGWVLTDAAGAVIRPLTADEVEQARRQVGVSPLAEPPCDESDAELVPDIDGALAALNCMPFADVAPTADVGHTGPLVSSPEVDANNGGSGRVLVFPGFHWVGSMG